MTWRGGRFFFPFDYSDCFPDSFRFSFGCKWRAETLPGCFLLSFYMMSGFGFQLLKRKDIFCSRVSKKFPLSFLALFNSFFTNIVKPRYFWEFIFRSVGFGNIWFAISIKVSVNWATGSSDRANSSDSRDIHRVRKDILSALSCVFQNSTFKIIMYLRTFMDDEKCQLQSIEAKCVHLNTAVSLKSLCIPPVPCTLCYSATVPCTLCVVIRSKACWERNFGGWG